MLALLYLLEMLETPPLTPFFEGNWGQKFTPVFLHIFVKFIKIEPSTKFYDVLNIYLKVMKLRRKRRHTRECLKCAMFSCSGYIETKAYLIESLENTCHFPCILFWFLCPLHLLYVCNFNLWWAKKPNCRAIYCSNTTGKTFWQNIFSIS